MRRRLLLSSLLSLILLVAAEARAGTVDIPDAAALHCRQSKPEWGWAACNQMLLKSVGVAESQEEQAAARLGRFGGFLVQAVTATSDQARICFGGKYKDEMGRPLAIVPFVLDAGRSAEDVQRILESLDAGRPVIVATERQGRVCVGVDTAEAKGGPRITRLRLLDPAAGPKVVELAIEKIEAEKLVGFMGFDVDFEEDPPARGGGKPKGVGLPGDWSGLIEINRRTQTLLVHIQVAPNGRYQATADMPGQNLKGFPTKVEARGASVTLTFTLPGVGVFHGELRDDKLAGTLLQAGQKTELELTR